MVADLSSNKGLAIAAFALITPLMACDAQTPEPSETLQAIDTVYERPARQATLQDVPVAVYRLKADCSGILQQGGLVICRSSPNVRLSASDGRPDTITDKNGVAVFGLSRNAVSELIITTHPDSENAWASETVLKIAPRDDKVTEIRGVPCEQIDPKKRSAEQQKNIERSWILKQEAWASFNTGPGATTGFIQPAEGRISSTFGDYRTYITEGCEPRNSRPHFGYDIAAPTGSQIIAPADGTVVLSDDDLFFEGGTVFLDHGHGLISVFMHMSEVDVEHGQVLKAGEHIGEVGSTGTATGPHLHWAVKYRHPDAPDRSSDFYIDPELLLSLPRPWQTE